MPFHHEEHEGHEEPTIVCSRIPVMNRDLNKGLLHEQQAQRESEKDER